MGTEQSVHLRVLKKEKCDVHAVAENLRCEGRAQRGWGAEVIDHIERLACLKEQTENITHELSIKILR